MAGSLLVTEMAKVGAQALSPVVGGFQFMPMRGPSEKTLTELENIFLLTSER